MSEYQYHEFCSLTKPLSKEVRKVMRSLSSRAQISTHGASYIYNYGDFRGNPKQLLTQYFDVYFYISNWGTVNLIFKYPAAEIDVDKIKKYAKKHLVSCEKVKNNIVVDVRINSENGFRWLEGEKWLPELLPFYDEIKFGDYRLLELAKAMDEQCDEDDDSPLDVTIKKIQPLTDAQKSLLSIFEMKF